MSDERSNSEDLSQAANAPASRPFRRSLLPRFGLRTLFIFAILFCLFFAGVGRNFVKMREEDAAIETLKQASAVILLQGDDFRARHPATPAPPGAPQGGGPNAGPAVEAKEDWYGRLFGWAERLPIRHVNLQSFDPDDENLPAALAALAVFPEIESVNLRGPGFDDSSLPPLTKIAGLEAVGLSDTVITAEGMRELALARELRALNLSGGSAGVAQGLSALTQLRTLSISDLNSTPGDPVGGRGGIETIAELPRLEDLKLMYLETTGPGFLAPLAGATKLRSLEIMGVPLTTDDVAAFADLPELESLRINNLDDAGLAKFGRLPKLRQIELDLPVSSEAAREFSKSHPDCRVEYASYRPEGMIFQGGEVIAAGPSRSR